MRIHNLFFHGIALGASLLIIVQPTITAADTAASQAPSDDSQYMQPIDPGTKLRFGTRFYGGVRIILPPEAPVGISGRDFFELMRELVSAAQADPIVNQDKMLSALNYALPFLSGSVGTFDDLGDAVEAVLRAGAAWSIKTYVTPDFLAGIPQDLILPSDTQPLPTPGIILNGTPTTVVAGQNVAAVMGSLVTLADTSPLAAEFGIISIAGNISAALGQGYLNMLANGQPVVNVVEYLSRIIKNSTGRVFKPMFVFESLPQFALDAINKFIIRSDFISSVPPTFLLPATAPDLDTPISIDGTTTSAIAGKSLLTVLNALLAIKSSESVFAFRNICNVLHYAAPNGRYGWQNDIYGAVLNFQEYQQANPVPATAT